MKGTIRYLNRVIVLVTLLVPVCIFLFLKYFGSNHFSVPVYYEQPGTLVNTECASVHTPYTISSFPFTNLGGMPGDSTWLLQKFSIVLIMDTTADPGNDQRISNLERVLSHYQKTGIIQVIQIFVDGFENIFPDDKADNKSKYLKVKGSRDNVSRFAQCSLFLPSGEEIFHQWVLVDPLGRIRGYYNPGRFDDIDRLIVETDILLKDGNYEE